MFLGHCAHPGSRSFRLKLGHLKRDSANGISSKLPTHQKRKSGFLFKLSLGNLLNLPLASQASTASARSSTPAAAEASAAGSRSQGQGLDSDSLQQDQAADEGQRGRRDGDGAGDEAERLGLVHEEGGDEEEDEDGGGEELHAAVQKIIGLIRSTSSC